MAQKCEGRRAWDAAGLGIGQLLGGVDCSELKRSRVESQQRFLISRVCVGRNCAPLVAELAFPIRRAI
ncbi:hypothetical protein Msil_2765 [Methylocella silvestris BL2]|uniref:Uncharacterized protein n=1 Tax=Methylocella silvestris (strain DSM 15510 / CIP 108128 / LMG 27833 / NCIMB 13906 / BL2) TaxID=395965 RepID=B8ERY7_METSB|nr:hypothetical protein Msil_2765 [Methylocella silvestris BL2]